MKGYIASCRISQIIYIAEEKTATSKIFVACFYLLQWLQFFVIGGAVESLGRSLKIKTRAVGFKSGL